MRPQTLLFLFNKEGGSHRPTMVLGQAEKTQGPPLGSIEMVKSALEDVNSGWETDAGVVRGAEK